MQFYIHLVLTDILISLVILYIKSVKIKILIIETIPKRNNVHEINTLKGEGGFIKSNFTRSHAPVKIMIKGFHFLLFFEL